MFLNHLGDDDLWAVGWVPPKEKTTPAWALRLPSRTLI
jgi:hypothetical protein